MISEPEPSTRAAAQARARSGILGPVHADDDATRGGHCYGLGAAPTFAASSASRLA